MARGSSKRATGSDVVEPVARQGAAYVTRWPAASNAGIWRRAMRAAWRLFADVPADLVLLHDPELLLPALRLRRPVTVWDVHEDTGAALSDKPWVPAAAGRPVRTAVRLLERLAERRFQLLLAEAGYRPRFRRDHPVVPNDAEVQRVVRASAPGRAVYVGRLSRGRGALDLIEVGRLLRGEVAVELVGPADDDIAGALGRADREGVVRWHGFVPNDRALPLLDGATAGLSLLHDEPNYRHSRPTKIIEYLARGVPVVTTPLPAAREVVDQARCGVVVPFEDPVAAAKAVLRLSRSTEERTAMAARGHALAWERYDWRRSGREFSVALEQWVSERAGR